MVDRVSWEQRADTAWNDLVSQNIRYVITVDPGFYISERAQELAVCGFRNQSQKYWVPAPWLISHWKPLC